MSDNQNNSSNGESAAASILAAAERLAAEEAHALEQVSEAEALLHEAKNRLAVKRDEIARAFGILSSRIAAPAPVSPTSAPIPDGDDTEIPLPRRTREDSIRTRALAWCAAQSGSFRADHLRRGVPGMTKEYATTFLSTERSMGRLRRVRKGLYAAKRAESLIGEGAAQ